MATPQLIDDLRRDEGYAEALPDGRCRAYPDPLSKGPPWTIAFGHTGKGIYPDLIWTRAQAEAALLEDIRHAEALCDHYLPWWRGLDQVRQDVLTNMMFNMGWDNLATAKHEGLSGFVNTLAAMQARDFERAAVGMAASEWARETKDRATRLIYMMRYGRRAGQEAGEAAPPVLTAPPLPPPVYAHDSANRPGIFGWAAALGRLFGALA